MFTTEKFPMRNLVSGSFCLLVLLAAACSRKLYPEAQGQEIILSADEFSKPVPADTTLIYKTGVDAYGRYLSGLLIIKSYNGDDYRLVFTTEMGMKLFDFEFKDNKFHVHYCFDKLNKKPVIRLLEKDFSMMLCRNAYGAKARIVDTKSYLLEQPRTKELWKIVPRTDSRSAESIHSLNPEGKPKCFIKYVYREGQCPDMIYIEHENLNLKMQLELLKR